MELLYIRLINNIILSIDFYRECHWNSRLGRKGFVLELGRLQICGWLCNFNDFVKEYKPWSEN